MTAEKILFDYLSQKLDVPVSMEVLNIDDYVLLEKVGGSINDHIESASFAIQSYGSSLYKACQLNERVKKAMDDILESDYISGCQLDSDYNHSDTQTKKYRYQAVYDLTLF